MLTDKEIYVHSGDVNIYCTDCVYVSRDRAYIFLRIFREVTRRVITRAE